MASRMPAPDIIAGGISAAGLVILVAVFGTGLWIAALLAIAAYIGIALALQKPAIDVVATPDPHLLAHQDAAAHLASVRRLEMQIVDPTVRDQVHRIADRISQTLAAMQEDGTFAVAPAFNEHLVEPFDSLMIHYVRLSNRGVRSAEPVLRKTEAHDLPLIEEAIDSFFDRLSRGTLVDLATQSEMLPLNIESMKMHSQQWRSSS